MAKLLLALGALTSLVLFSNEASAQTAICPSSQSVCRYVHLNTNGTTLVKTGTGVLHTLTINTIGDTDTVTIYDGTSASGTIIAKTDSALETTFIFDVAFYTGLTVVLSGTTPADITISYN